MNYLVVIILLQLMQNLKVTFWKAENKQANIENEKKVCETLNTVFKLKYLFFSKIRDRLFISKFIFWTVCAKDKWERSTSLIFEKNKTSLAFF